MNTTPQRVDPEIVSIASKFPSRCAIMWGSSEMTYGSLIDHACELESRLYSAGAEEGAVVALLTAGGPDAVVAQLAAMMARCICVSLDVNEPQARLQHILRDSRPFLILTKGAWVSRVPQGYPFLLLERLGPPESIGQPDCVLPGNAVHLVYTSGSTGQPKGVIRNHQGILSRLKWMDIRDSDVFCHNMPLSAGFSQERLFIPLLCGLPLVMIPEDHFGDMARMAADAEAFGITQLTLVPIMLKRLLDLGPSICQRLRRLRILTCGGAELSPDLITRFREALPDTVLFNTYGSTETGTVAFRRIESSTPDGNTIGSPAPGAKVYFIDEDGKPTSDEIGEMFVNASSLAEGYWRQPHLTAEKFLPDTFVSGPGERMYRTGDLGRRLPSGEIEFRGRADRQVKVRGYRVELREVEAALERCCGVVEAVVCARKLDLEARLTGYLVIRDHKQITIGALRKQLEYLLPDYMIPLRFVVLRELPRLLGGKVDFGALPNPDRMRPVLDAPFVAPRTANEQVLADLCEEILDIRGIGIHDNFIELGGDSLSAARVVVEIIGRFDQELPLDLMFEPGTIASLAAYLESDCSPISDDIGSN